MINSPDACPLCGCFEINIGYGYGVGIFGGYEVCNGCEEVIGLFPDLEGMEEDRIVAIKQAHQKWRDNLDAKISARDKGRP